MSGRTWVAFTGHIFLLCSQECRFQPQTPPCQVSMAAKLQLGKKCWAVMQCL